MSRQPAGVEPDGILLDAAIGGALDLLLDGRRVWSFRPEEVGEARRRGRFVAWPRDLAKALRGRALVVVRDAAGQVLVEREMVFAGPARAGEGPGRAGSQTGDAGAGADRADADEGAARVRLADRHGNLLVVDTGGRLVRTFENRGALELHPLIEATVQVIDALTRHGLAAFPAYGTLLGAVRSGRVIGHDNDADVAYVSQCTHPADVILESFGLQRLLHAEGYEISRYSGAGFKIVVGAGTGAPIGLDVFTGFFSGGRLTLMGEIHQPFERDWIFPLGEVELEGRRLPAPARPEKLLEAMYGPSWRVPDPTFVFSTSDAVKDRLNAWFRGTRSFRNLWDRRYSVAGHRPPRNRGPHDLARLLARSEEPGTQVLDLGCGRGQDVMFLARQHFEATGFDFSPEGFRFLAARARESGLSAEFATGNLLDSRHVVAWCARFGMRAGPKAMLARHLLDATTANGRDGVWRLASTVLGVEGGRLYLEFMTPQPRVADLDYVDGLLVEVEADWVAWEAERVGGTVVSSEILEARGYELPAEPVGADHPPRKCRMVVEWRP